MDGSDGKLEASRLQELIHDSIKTVLQIVKIRAERLTGTAFVMVKPIRRPAVDWYSDFFGTTCRFFDEEVDEIAITHTNTAHSVGHPLRGHT